MIGNVTLRLKPGSGEIVIDGTHIEHGVSSLALHASANDIPRLLLSIDTHEVEVDGQMEVRLLPAERDALIALGWTPPAEEAGRA